MKEGVEVRIDGKTYKTNFPSINRVNELQKILGVDVFADPAVAKAPTAMCRNLDSTKTYNALKIILGTEATSQMAEEMTPARFSKVVMSFFFPMVEEMRADGPTPSDASTEAGPEQTPLPADGPST